MSSPQIRHLLSLFDFSTDEIREVLAVSRDLKSRLAAGIREPRLAGRVLALLFEKPSLRTRVSFEAGMAQLGGATLFLSQDVGWRSREAPQDFGRVLGQYVDLVVCRAKLHDHVEELARWCGRPVINGLTDLYHPCQALADIFTLQEVCGDGDLKLAYVGDANNVARSLAICCGKLGIRFAIATPPGYRFDRPFVERLKREVPAVELTETSEPADAVADADAVYTDVWTSMGQEAEQERRRQDFAAFQVDAALMRRARPNAAFLHCLPARRGEEVVDEVIDSPHSAVVEQAGNRMHVQKGLMCWLLGQT